MKRFILFMMLCFCMVINVFAALSIEVTTEQKSKIKNTDLVVTNVTVSGTSDLDVNTASGASVADININGKEIKLTAKNPDFAATLKGMILVRLSDTDEDMSTKNYKNASDTVEISGVTYRVLPLMSAKTIDKKLDRRLPKWTTAAATSLPEITSENTPEDLINGYNALRQFLIDNSVESVVTETEAGASDGPAIIGGNPVE